MTSPGSAFRVPPPTRRPRAGQDKAPGCITGQVSPSAVAVASPPEGPRSKPSRAPSRASTGPAAPVSASGRPLASPSRTAPPGPTAWNRAAVQVARRSLAAQSADSRPRAAARAATRSGHSAASKAARPARLSRSSAAPCARPVPPAAHRATRQKSDTMNRFMAKSVPAGTRGNAVPGDDTSHGPPARAGRAVRCTGAHPAARRP